MIYICGCGSLRPFLLLKIMPIEIIERGNQFLARLVGLVGNDFVLPPITEYEGSAVLKFIGPKKLWHVALDPDGEIVYWCVEDGRGEVEFARVLSDDDLIENWQWLHE